MDIRVGPRYRHSFFSFLFSSTCLELHSFPYFHAHYLHTHTKIQIFRFCVKTVLPGGVGCRCFFSSLLFCFCGCWLVLHAIFPTEASAQSGFCCCVAGLVYTNAYDPLNFFNIFFKNLVRLRTRLQRAYVCCVYTLCI